MLSTVRTLWEKQIRLAYIGVLSWWSAAGSVILNILCSNPVEGNSSKPVSPTAAMSLDKSGFAKISILKTSLLGGQQTIVPHILYKNQWQLPSSQWNQYDKDGCCCYRCFCKRKLSSLQSGLTASSCDAMINQGACDFQRPINPLDKDKNGKQKFQYGESWDTWNGI